MCSAHLLHLALRGATPLETSLLNGLVFEPICIAACPALLGLTHD
jgi:hypothetical protein